jgi:hypothetical protein
VYAPPPPAVVYAPPPIVFVPPRAYGHRPYGRYGYAYDDYGPRWRRY